MSILSDLNSLVLRDTSNPPLTNKGSALDFSEADGNIVKIFNAIQDIVSGANVPAYDAGATYDYYSTDAAEKFVSYDSKIWSAVYVGSPSSFSGQTPAESSYWSQVTLAQMLGNPIALTKIADAFDDSRNPDTIYVSEWLSSSNLSLQSAPLDIVGCESPVLDNVLSPVGVQFGLDFGGSAFDFPASGIFIAYSTTPTVPLATIPQASINNGASFNKYLLAEADQTKLSDKLVLTALSDATVGAGTYWVRVFFRDLTLPF